MAEAERRTGRAAAVAAERVVKRFGSGEAAVRALDEVSVAIARNEFFTLLGPSGCGKTTLLRLIAGFETPDAGRILLGGQDITALPPHRRPVNTVFQSYALFPHMSVADNVAFGLRMQGKPNAGDRAREMLALVRLEKMAERRPDQLSGGQQQRVALARALAPSPEVLLLDEPLAALDLKLRKEMQIELKRLQHETGITFVFVTHDQEEALTMSDRIAVMKDGRILQTGTPREIYNAPVNRFVADFIGETNFLPAVIDGAVARLETGEHVALPRSHATGRATLAVRPEQVRLGSEGPIAAEVAQTVYFGTDTHCHLRLADGSTLVARLQSPPSGETGLAAGQHVRVGFTEGAVQVLDA